MNPYELSQSSSDTIQSLLDTAHTLHDQTDGHFLAHQLHLRLTQLQQVHSRSWHLLRHNNEHAEFIMARLESMDVLCGRLVPLMNSARAIHAHKMKLKKSRSLTSYGYEVFLIKNKSPKLNAPPPPSCCFPSRDHFAQLLEAMSEFLGSWLDHQEEVLELLSCQAFGVFSRMHGSTLQGYHPLPKVMRQVAEALFYGRQSCVVVHGPSGVGKSSLASYVAANPPDRFSDGAVEVHVGKTQGDEYKLVGKLRHLLQDMNCHFKEQKVMGLNECWRLLEEAVHQTSHLIILDDVCEPEVLNRIMQLRHHSCMFLVTCQDAPVSYNPDSVSVVRVGFKETAAISTEVLKLHTGVLEEKMLPTAAKKILRYCSHHPLSVAILGEALRGSWRKEEWNAVVNHFEVTCTGGQRKKGKRTPPNWLTGVFGSIELGTVGLEQETVSLFDSLAALSWSQPVPVECLKALWLAVQESCKEPSSFLFHARELVRRCLLKRRPDFVYYDLHELVELYLERKAPKAIDVLVNLSEAGTRAVVAPWLLQFGNSAAKEAAASALHGVFLLDNEELHAKSLLSIVDVLKACKLESSSSLSSSRDDIRKQASNVVSPEIINLLSRASSPGVYAAITKYIAVCFKDVDYHVYGNRLVASGLVEKLKTLLSNKSGSGGVNILVKKDVADVVAKLATACKEDGYVKESLAQGCVVQELVQLLDSRSGWINEAVINALLKVAGLGEETVRQVLETDFLEKLLVLLQNRKQIVKCRALETLVMLIRAGGGKVVERVSELGILDEVELMLACPCEDVQVSACVFWKEVFLRASESSLERLVKSSRVVEALTRLFTGEPEMEVVMNRATDVVRVLVQLKGDTVRERVARAAGVELFQLETMGF